MVYNIKVYLTNINKYIFFTLSTSNEPKDNNVSKGEKDKIFTFPGSAATASVLVGSTCKILNTIKYQE